MHKITLWLLWAVVFSVPCEDVVVLLGGSLTRLFGMAAVGAGVLTIIASGRLRRPGSVLYIALTFALIAMMSLLWTASSAATIGRAFTYAQLLGLAWLVWEFARTTEEQESLMLAYCLGAFVTIADLIRRFVSGLAMIEMRFTGANQDPNDLGVTLAIGIPIAWHLFLNRRGIPRILAALYVPFALVAILLTASRGAFVAMLAALSIIPLTVQWRSFRSMALTAAVFAAAVTSAAAVVPGYSWSRISSLPNAALDGTIGGRLEIWKAGLEAFQQHPMLGAGAGAFDVAIEPFLGRMASHNVFVAVLVEQGLVGIVVFGMLLATCAWYIYRLSGRERKIFGVIALTWLIGSMSLSWQYQKTTWLILGLISAQAAVVAPPVGRSRYSRGMRLLPIEEI